MSWQRESRSGTKSHAGRSYREEQNGDNQSGEEGVKMLLTRGKLHDGEELNFAFAENADLSNGNPEGLLYQVADIVFAD
jgi:hypothetical protein